MDLTARREPTFGSSGDHGQFSDYDATAAAEALSGPRATRLARLIATTQIVGSLLAVPVGLASAYSIYRANFSPETTCQTLRGNIIGLLDKNVDATTMRMLVRRDVESFERNCGGVDPDAHAAFKRLLAVDLAAPLPKAGPAVKPVKVERKLEAKVEKTETKVEARAEAKVDSKPKIAAKAEIRTEMKAEPAEHEAPLTDARWVAAVREALVKHGPERTVSDNPEPPVLQKAWIAPPPAAPEVTAPQLAPAQTLSAPVNAVDHPVPPAPIPNAQPAEMVQAGNVNNADRSRLERWIANIPLVGPAIAR